ncbi:ribosome maturation factor RimM [Leptospira adleri]|uniref:Ribosome maturation factor RimM n=1 Tax=Leptospira adleri TaxID=2023186 RepID=A0A2M9YJD9_9LEPT|nr:ribosome maturation factor RimM [Leptospira adleri]PJZ51665.1 16S rRNA processing protein RimM [Leptospira adleri]PJZ62150.1 16S rRNA processing protein RimM [Leptospira adleri]
MTEGWISLGQLGKPFGIKGFLRFNVRETVLTEFKLPIQLKLRKPDPNFPEKEITVLELQPHTGKFIVRIEGIDSPEAAERLTGGILLLPAHLLPKIQTKDEFYISDLIGLEAVDQSGNKLNWTLREVLENPAHPILAFTQKEGPEILIPFIHIYVGEVDLEKKTVALIHPEVWNEV